MSEDVEALVKAERLQEAAEICAENKDFARASALFERACVWDRAAACALDAGDPARAMELAILAENELIASTAFAAISRDEAASKRCAERLAQRGEHAWAARLFEAVHQDREAALAWSRAGDAVRAAKIFEARSEPVEAARVLETAIRKRPDDWAASAALGALLLRYGKIEAAVRALQTIPKSARERRAALVSLALALEKLGLETAAKEARAELDALGGAPEATPTPAIAEARSRIYGRYDIVRQVSSNATARVLECVDVIRQEKVAVKLFSNDGRPGGRDALARFEREIRVLSALDHPNVVPMRDYFPDGPAIVLEWMSGGTLETMVAREPIAPARAIEIACAVLSALGEAHRVEILHRDVKPANVLFDAAGVTRLGDFGVAHLGDLTATATAGVIGTLAYMSPEQRRGEPATVESDVYGVGAMLLEMLTGEPGARDPSARKLPSGAHRDLDARHDRLVSQMIADDPSARPRGALEARKLLTSIHWPTSLEPAAPIARRDETREEDHGERVRTEENGVAVDTWIGRPIERLRLDEPTRARAAIFARSGHPSLQTIYRVDRARGEIWLEKLAPLRSEIEPNSRVILQDAIVAMDATKANDRIENAHVGVRPNGELVIRFSILQGSTIA